MAYSPTSPYFPERFLAQYDGVAELLVPFQDADFDQYADPTWQLRDAIRQRNPQWADPGQTYPVLEDEVQLLHLILEFCRSEENLFALDTKQPNLLPSSVLDELQWQEVNAPRSACVYLHLGIVRDVLLPLDLVAPRYGWEEDIAGDTFLEGAFVRRTSWRALEILLIMRTGSEPAPGLAGSTGAVTPPMVWFTIDKAGGINPKDLLNACVLTFADLWDPTGRAGELEIGTMRKLLRTRSRRPLSAELQQYEFLVNALRCVLASLKQHNLCWPKQLSNLFDGSEPPARLQTVKPFPDVQDSAYQTDV